MVGQLQPRALLSGIVVEIEVGLPVEALVLRLGSRRVQIRVRIAVPGKLAYDSLKLSGQAHSVRSSCSPGCGGMSSGHRPLRVAILKERNKVVGDNGKQFADFSVEPEECILDAYYREDLGTQGQKHRRRGCCPGGTEIDETWGLGSY